MFIVAMNEVPNRSSVIVRHFLQHYSEDDCSFLGNDTINTVERAIPNFPTKKSMTLKELILQEIENIRDTLLQEVLDFIQFLQAKHQLEMSETMLLSESSLQKDWLKAEEEEAWQDL